MKLPEREDHALTWALRQFTGKADRITDIVPVQRLLISDFERWHQVLAGCFLPVNRADDEAMTVRYSGGVPGHLILKSWTHVFEIGSSGTRGARVWQLSLDRLHASEIIAIRTYSQPGRGNYWDGDVCPHRPGVGKHHQGGATNHRSGGSWPRCHQHLSVRLLQGSRRGSATTLENRRTEADQQRCQSVSRMQSDRRFSHASIAVLICVWRGSN